jgi:hypothetical protein
LEAEVSRVVIQQQAKEESESWIANAGEDIKLDEKVTEVSIEVL